MTMQFTFADDRYIEFAVFYTKIKRKNTRMQCYTVNGLKKETMIEYNHGFFFVQARLNEIQKIHARI